MPPAPRSLVPASTQGQSHGEIPNMRRYDSVIARENVRDEMAAIVRRTVDPLRRGGMKTEQATEVAGRRLGISPRRVRAYLYGEVFSVPAHEAVGILDGWRRSQAARIEALEAEIEAERRNLEHMDARCRDVSAALAGAAGMKR